MCGRRISIAGALTRGLCSIVEIAFLLFLSAGTIHYQEAWVLLGVIICVAILSFVWLYRKQPSQLDNRLNPKELNKIQQRLVFLIGLTLSVSLVVAGLDKRFSISHITTWRYVPAGMLLYLSMWIYYDVFTKNPFLSNTVKIHENHRIVKQGMYGVVRHPMYLATCMSCAIGMIILGSWLCLPLYCCFIALINLRIKYEEKELNTSLPEYADYMAEVKCRLIPLSLLWRRHGDETIPTEKT